MVGLYNDFTNNDTSGYTQQNVQDALLKAVGQTDPSQFSNGLSDYMKTYAYNAQTGITPYQQLASDVITNLGGNAKFGANARQSIASMLSSVEGLNTIAKYAGQDSFNPATPGVLKTPEDKLGNYGDYISSMLQHGGNSLSAFERDAGRVDDTPGSNANYMDLLSKLGNEYGQAKGANNASLSGDLAGTDFALRYLAGQRFGGAAQNVLTSALGAAGRVNPDDTQGPGAIVNRFWEQLPSRLEGTGFENAWQNAQPNRWRPYPMRGSGPMTVTPVVGFGGTGL